MNGPKIRVLVVDDSSFMRKVLGDLLSADPRIELAGTARDGEDALVKIEKFSPDVVTLDVEMPRKDGLATLDEIMRRFPLPVIMVSSLTSEGAQTTLRALSAGAVDFVAKPSGHNFADTEALGRELSDKVAAASGARIFKRYQETEQGTSGREKSSVFPPLPSGKTVRPEIVAMAASTGGPRALQSVLSEIPGDFPVPIVIVQHMPRDFTLSFARRLDSLCALDVQEGREGMELRPGLAVVSPGGYHMVVRRKSPSLLCCGLDDGPPVLSVKPSANVLFLSVAEATNGRAVGVILTGMGRDGAEGAAAMHARGSCIIAESRGTCVVYGMPKSAAELGVVDELLPLGSIPEAVLRSVRA